MANQPAFNPFINPATQAQIDRQRQMALMLQQQALEPTQGQMVSGHYVGPSWAQGLAKLLQGYTSKKINENADTQQGQLWQQQNEMLQNALNRGRTQPDASKLGQAVLNYGAQSSPNDANNNNTAGVGPTVQNAQTLDSIPQSNFPNQSGPSGGNFDMENLLASNAIGAYGGEPAQTAYWKQYEPTDATRMAMAAGIDPAQANSAALQKANYIAPTSLRSGAGYLTPDGTYHTTPSAAPEGYMNMPDPTSPTGFKVMSSPGGTAAIQGNQQASTLGKTMGTLNQGVDATGNPAYFVGLPPGLSGSVPGGANTPTNGMPTNNFNTPYPVTFGAPGSTPTDQREGTNTNQSVAVRNPTQSGGQAIRPANPPGFNEYQQTLASGSGKRTNDLINLAADSPTRVNVLDNIINLSKNGVATGPTQEWRNALKGMAADSLGIKSWQNDVSGFQEIKKFLLQNGQRAWSAAGGTGTDAQLDAAMHANPNDKMFPQAIQTMANWAKAGELATQGKANAFQNANINNPQGQQQFEQIWRNNLDPRIYQMRLMDPQTAQAFVASLKKSNPQDYQSLLQKAQNLKQMGGL